MARVALFDPCYLLMLRPRETDYARRVLEALGDEVTIVDGRCCGQPAFNSGYRDDARAVGREALRAATEHERLVVPSGSCTTMLQHFLPGLYDGQRREHAESLAHRFIEFTDYVEHHPQVDRLALKLEGTVAYHDACHYRRELGLTATAIALLGRVDGLDVRRLRFEAECCGFGGTFSVKLPEVAGTMLRAKLDDVTATGAKVLVSADFSCLAHIDAGARGLGLPVETWTIAELLARALG